MIKRMRIWGILICGTLAIAAVLALPSFALRGESFTGEVSDSMCGAEHMMKGSKADCARACVAKGSNYALVVGDKVYALETKDKTVLDRLNELAGRRARIIGKAYGDSIVVNTVAPAK
jgi:hypothetical protein